MTQHGILAATFTEVPWLPPGSRAEVWLGDEPLPPARVAQLCRPLPADLLTGRRVDVRVNSVRYEAADCLAPA